MKGEINPHSSTAPCVFAWTQPRLSYGWGHQQLLSERSSRRQISAAALSAGVRAANVAKTLATVAQSKASSDRRFAQRDALQEAQKFSPALPSYEGLFAEPLYLGATWRK